MAAENNYVLDTSAVLALRGNEPGADRVEEILRRGASGRARVRVSFMTRMELQYCIERDEGVEAAVEAIRLLDAAGVGWVSCEPDILERAARLKAMGGLSVADAWIAATALLHDARLVHKDPELDGVQDLKQERLPDGDHRGRSEPAHTRLVGDLPAYDILRTGVCTARNCSS